MAKKIIFSFWLLLAAGMATVALSACGKEETTIYDLKLSQQTLKLVTGEEYALSATFNVIGGGYGTGDFIKPIWTSSNENVATVVEGKVTPKAAGMATITLTLATETAACEVTVVDIHSYSDSVVINGVKWATRNVDAPGTFAAKLEDGGMFYQWNRKIGWSIVDPMANSGGGTTWDSSQPSGTEWAKANDPSPAGWRVPTAQECASLANVGKVTIRKTAVNGVPGQLFSDNITGNTLFLPAVGYRQSSDGHIGVEQKCCYWSSTHTQWSDGEYAHSLLEPYNDCNQGNSVRPVAD